jgi:hypothetical protein
MKMSIIVPIIRIRIIENPADVQYQPYRLQIQLKIGTLHSVNLFLKMFAGFMRTVFRGKDFRIVGVEEWEDKDGLVVYRHGGK